MKCKKYLVFGGGVITGIVLSILFAVIVDTLKDNKTWFDTPGDVINEKAFHVFQVVDDKSALVIGQHDFTGAVYLLTNDERKYYYDEEIVVVPEGMKARQVGLFSYRTKLLDIHKTVPIIKFVKE